MSLPVNAIGNIVQEFEYKGAEKKSGKKCEAVLRSVPEWFGIEESLLKYVKEQEIKMNKYGTNIR